MSRNGNKAGMLVQLTEQYIISEDGTRVGYRQSGKGPGLVICHGGGRISQNYQKLAEALSESFTVYIPDRRGRGLSGAEGSSYHMKEATEDLIAILRSTGAQLVSGHSA